MINLTYEKIKELEKQYALPLYVFNQDEFVANYHELETTFQGIYPDYHICYSYKTNYTPAICQLVKSLGGYAEVVSDMEYQLALAVGYKPEKIVYNGPHKGKQLEAHLLAGGINNVDNTEEAERICRFAQEHSREEIKTGIRLNLDIDAGYISRFGIGTDQLDQIFQKFSAYRVKVNGLHCHMSRARGLEAWRRRGDLILGLVRKYQLDELEYISLGSGMFGHMDPELKAQFSDVPTYTDYGEAVIRQFAEYYQNKDHKPLLFTEPGTTIVSKYVDFVARVEGIKRIRGKDFILCNCSFHNLGETCQMKNLPIKVFANGNKHYEVKDASLVGYTCLEQDVLYRNFTGNIAIGDYIMFGNVGGYSLVDKPPFIQPNCAMIAISGSEQKMIKRPENWDDIFTSFVF